MKLKDIEKKESSKLKHIDMITGYAQF